MMKDRIPRIDAGEVITDPRNRSTAWMTLLLVGLAVGWAGQAVAEPPPSNPVNYVPPGLVNYQGTLLTEAGEPYTNGVYDIDFRLYPAAGGGVDTSVWGASYKVFVRDGVFGVMLGQPGGANLGDHPGQYDADELWKAMWFDDDDPQTELFLGITVKQDENLNTILPSASESIPRQQFLVTPFAARAQQAQFARRSAGTFDVGGQLIATNGITANGMTVETATFSDVVNAQTVNAQTFAGAVQFGQAIGNITMHHTFNGLVKVPRGWMICNNQQVTSANYNALHGAGAYVADGIGTSPLVNKYLPNLVNRYAVGASDTPANGSGAIPTLGNAGHQVDLQHVHTVEAHNHKIYDYKTSTTSADYYDASGINRSLSGQSAGNATTDTGGRALGVDRDGDGIHGLKEDAFTDNEPETETGAGLSSQQDIQPDSVQVLYIIKVK